MSLLDKESLSLVRVVRSVLIEHLDGRRIPFIAFGSVPRFSRTRAVRMLLTYRMLRLEGCNTSITEKGRAALAEMLADWADALASAEWADPRLHHVSRVTDFQAIPA